MIRINLLPFRSARRKENVRRQVSLFLLSLILVLLALFYFNFSLNSKISKLKKQIKTTTAELEKYNEINREIARIKQKLENLRKKMAVIDLLDNNRHEPVKLLDTMTKMIVPKRMWFTLLQEKEQSKVVVIEGIALDNKTVADFMVRLQGCGLFSAVNLKTLKHKGLLNNNLKSFQISCVKLAPTTPEAQSAQTKAKT
jgi:type IV pilus assembly protein PilN